MSKVLSEEDGDTIWNDPVDDESQSNQEKIHQHLSDQKNLEKAAEGSMEKRQALIDRVDQDKELDEALEELVRYIERGEANGRPFHFIAKYKDQITTWRDKAIRQAEIRALKVARHDVEFAERWTLSKREILANMDERINTLEQQLSLLNEEEKDE